MFLHVVSIVVIVSILSCPIDAGKDKEDNIIIIGGEGGRGGKGGGGMPLILISK